MLITSGRTAASRKERHTLVMQWEALCTRYLAARGSPDFDEVEQQVLADISPQIGQLTPSDGVWFVDAIADADRKWFVAFVFEFAPTLPEMLFAPLLQAAITERNPSFNRWFVEPCVRAFGHRRVVTALLEVVEHGSDFEKAGAVNALYWASVPLIFHGTAPSFDHEHATAESRAAYDALDDLWLRKRCLFLQTFISNADVHVRRSLIPSLVLNPTAYPDTLQPLVNEAIQIARTHPDDYIRHRVEVQLGTEHLLRPLPHRE
jgi:hypothetical protein